jgi:hypothetical protein
VFERRELSPSREQLLALAAKYDAMGALRRARAAGGDVADRRDLAALAKRFPGVLRELELLPDEAIETRTAGIARALATGVAEPWMTWLYELHATLAFAIAMKTALGRRPSRVRAVAWARAREGADAVEDAFVDAVLADGRPKLVDLALDRIAMRHEVSRERIEAALFPRKNRKSDVV